MRIENSGSISANAPDTGNTANACAGGVVGRNQMGIMDGDFSCTLNDSGEIKATAGENNAVVTASTEGGIGLNDKAYAGTKIGYDVIHRRPVACTTTTPAA